MIQAIFLGIRKFSSRLPAARGARQILKQIWRNPGIRAILIWGGGELSVQTDVADDLRRDARWTLSLRLSLDLYPYRLILIFVHLPLAFYYSVSDLRRVLFRVSHY